MRTTINAGLACKLVMGLMLFATAACTRRGRELEAAVAVAQSVAEESKYAQQGRPRVGLDDHAGPSCELFSKYITDCPLVPSCADARVTQDALTINACLTERHALARVVACGSAKSQNEARCVLSTFVPCRRFEGERCEFELAVCERSDRTLGVARCCNDPSAMGCDANTYVVLEPRPIATR